MLPGPRTRRLFQAACLMSLLMLLAAACSLPVLAPSTSLWYKFGLDKDLLLAGKMCGLAAGVLVLVQLVLAARIRALDRIVSLNRLLGLHRSLGIAALCLAIAHPLLVFAPEDVRSIPVSPDYWPEALGAVMLLALWFTVSTAVKRQVIGLPYRAWKYGHRTAGVLLAGMLCVHVLYVSDSFASGWPRQALVFGMTLFAGLWLWVRSKPLRLRRHPYRLMSLSRAGKDAFALDVEPEGGSKRLGHAPGQFAFLRFSSQAVTAEEHPFTIASRPRDGSGLQFIIRCSGDWTAGIGGLSTGDRVMVDGPYGLFSHLAWPGYRAMLMIAGGVGITPMLSMLRHMAASGETRPATLVWSNRTRQDIVCPEAFEYISARLSGFRLIHVLTRESPPGWESGRLDREKIKRCLPAEGTKGLLALVCGPPAMSAQVRRHLQGLGVARRCIKTELFSL